MTALQSTNLDVGTQRIELFKMAHLVYRCADRKSMLEWYRKLFQADLVFEDDILTFITYDDEHHRMAFFNMPDLPGKTDDMVGVHHIAYSYHRIGELLATYERLKALDILPVWTINHGQPPRCTTETRRVMTSSCRSTTSSMPRMPPPSFIPRRLPTTRSAPNSMPMNWLLCGAQAPAINSFVHWAPSPLA